MLFVVCFGILLFVLLGFVRWLWFVSLITLFWFLMLFGYFNCLVICVCCLLTDSFCGLIYAFWILTVWVFVGVFAFVVSLLLVLIWWIACCLVICYCLWVWFWVDDVWRVFGVEFVWLICLFIFVCLFGLIVVLVILRVGLVWFMVGLGKMVAWIVGYCSVCFIASIRLVEFMLVVCFGLF